jgi:hypothetical protein
MRLAQPRKARSTRGSDRRKTAPKRQVEVEAGAYPSPSHGDEEIPRAADSVGGVAVEEAARSALDPKRSKRSKWLIGLTVLSVFAAMPLEPRLREQMAGVGRDARTRIQGLVGSFGGRGSAPTATVAAAAGAAPSQAAEPVPTPRFRAGRGPLGGGVFSLPPDLRVAEDGTVDLLIHFHGNTEMVLESVEHAKVGAATVVVNLGVGSGPYEERFDNPVNFTDLLTRIEGAIEKRGVERPKLGRIALSSWSAGYGAVLRVLKNPGLVAKIDSVILLDGLHVGYREDGSLNWQSIEPFEAFADRAVRGETMFVVTHSNIQPVDYLGVKETSDHILERLGMSRSELTGTTVLPPFESFRGVLPKADMIPLTRATEARKGSFVVRGFRGNEPHTHMAHLMQMSEIGLADLTSRWRSPAR